MTETLILLSRHRGIWEGRYTHLDATTLTVVERQLFRIRVEVFPDGDPAYRQTSHYWWPEGREEELVYEGAMRDGALLIDTGRMWGAARAIAADTLYLEFGYSATPALRIAEMIQLSADGAHRARTWHWLRSGALERITLVREQRCSDDPAEWRTHQARPDLVFD